LKPRRCARCQRRNFCRSGPRRKPSTSQQFMQPSKSLVWYLSIQTSSPRSR
jgi:hypothetical protein